MTIDPGIIIRPEALPGVPANCGYMPEDCEQSGFNCKTCEHDPDNQLINCPECETLTPDDCGSCAGIGRKLNRLQVKVGINWEYVFCRNPLQIDPVITANYKKAIKGHGLDYFRQHFAGHTFRIV